MFSIYMNGQVELIYLRNAVLLMLVVDWKLLGLSPPNALFELLARGNL